MTATTNIDHAATAARMRTLDADALRFIITDATGAIEAMPNGHKAGYYADEINYAAAELKRRESPTDRTTDYSQRYLQAEAVRLAKSYGRRCSDWSVEVRNSGRITLRVTLGEALKRAPKDARVADAGELANGIRQAL